MVVGLIAISHGLPMLSGPMFGVSLRNNRALVEHDFFITRSAMITEGSRSTDYCEEAVPPNEQALERGGSNRCCSQVHTRLLDCQMFLVLWVVSDMMTADSSTATDSCDEATLVAERWQRRYCCAVYGQGCVYMSPCPCVTSNSVMLFI